MDEEVYLIMTNRSDGKLPSVVKTWDAKMCANIEDAQYELETCENQECAQHAGVYRAIVRVEERVS